MRQEAFCFSRLHERRLRAEGFSGPITVLRGLYEGGAEGPPQPAEPVVVFAGRHIPEKRVTAVVPAFERARELVPGLRCVVFGDGPQRPEVLRQIDRAGLEGVVEAPGFVEQARVEQTLRTALCLVLPSVREGYGLVVVEAAARGTPSVVVAAPDNAAVELVEDGVNGFVAPSASPEELAEAIVRAHRAGQPLREATASWFSRNADTLSLESSLQIVLDRYEPEGLTVRIVRERVTFSGHQPPWIRHEHLARYLFASERVEGKVVVDCACGDGTCARILAPRARNVWAFDLSEDAVRNARAATDAENVRFAVAGATALPVPDSSADTYVSLETIEHLPDQDAFLAEVVRVLKPSGEFVCSTPDRDVYSPGNTLDEPSVESVPRARVLAAGVRRGARALLHARRPLRAEPEDADTRPHPVRGGTADAPKPRRPAQPGVEAAEVPLRSTRASPGAPGRAGPALRAPDRRLLEKPGLRAKRFDPVERTAAETPGLGRRHVHDRHVLGAATEDQRAEAELGAAAARVQVGAVVAQHEPVAPGPERRPPSGS